jgi:hypothetical protein
VGEFAQLIAIRQPCGVTMPALVERERSDRSTNTASRRSGSMQPRS